MYNNCSTMGGETFFTLLSNALDTKGEGVGGGIHHPRWRFCFLIGVLNPGFGALYSFK